MDFRPWLRSAQERIIVTVNSALPVARVGRVISDLERLRELRHARDVLLEPLPDSIETEGRRMAVVEDQGVLEGGGEE
jgi:hypothetical protein